MKWNKEQEQQLKALCFEEKSNKEIATIMGIDITDVHSGRSRFGVTVAKVSNLKNVQVVDPKVGRLIEDIVAEITKVEKAQVEATKKVWKCTERLEVLRKELDEVK